MEIGITGREQRGSKDFYLFLWIMFSRILCNEVFLCVEEDGDACIFCLR